MLYIDTALRRAAALLNLDANISIVTLDGDGSEPPGGIIALLGTAWDAKSVMAEQLIQALKPADIVYVHQCMTEIGLFVAAHARLLGKRVFGSDAGAGEATILEWAPDILEIYEGLHSISQFSAHSFGNTIVPVHIVPGPVDTERYVPGAQPRDKGLAVSVGRVMRHKGYERTIGALPAGLRLAIIGQHYDPPYLEYLRWRADGKDVEFLDDLDDAGVQAMLLQAGVFVHASTHTDYQGRFYHKPELLGLAPLEAIASGTPTVVSDAGSLAELGALPGCHVFESEQQLASILNDFVAGRLPEIEPAVMHRAVVEGYGLAATGMGLLKMMKLAGA